MLARLRAWLDRRKDPNAASTNDGKAEIAAVTVHPFVPPGNCARCGFNRNNNDRWLDVAPPQSPQGVCLVRGFDITEPSTTYCKNFESRDRAPYGATFTILPAHGNIGVPWVDLAVPRESQATCCVCGKEAFPGILLTLHDGQVGACGPEHYVEWWTDYQRRRLHYFERLGEKAYGDMYDVVFSGAAAHYSNAKEAFYSAISTARDLELVNEQHALEKRLAHIKNVFRSQFK